MPFYNVVDNVVKRQPRGRVRAVRHRLKDVAERAGTSAPGVLYWFATKDELLTEALAFSDERFYAELSEQLERLGL